MSIAVVLAVVVTVVLAVVQRGDRHEVAPRPVDVARASPAEAAAALATLVSGVESADAAALSDLVAPGAPGAGEALAGVAANTESLGLTDVSARYVDQVGAVANDGTWSAVAEVGWRVAGDTVPSQADVVVRFAPAGDGVGIVGFGGDGTGRVPLWLRGELSVGRAPGVLVMVDGSQDEADAVVDRVTRGIGVVRRVLPEWREPVVVEVPASAAELDETLGATPGTYAGIAAVTATAGSSSTADAPVHVFVNPDVTAGLRRAGAQVVMSHELVHVATDAARGVSEPWLVEGFADYVALRDTAAAGPYDARSGDRRGPRGRRTRRAAGRLQTSTPATVGCRRATRRPGWRAGSLPSGWGSEACWRCTTRWPQGRRCRGARDAGAPEARLVRSWRAR